MDYRNSQIDPILPFYDVFPAQITAVTLASTSSGSLGGMYLYDWAEQEFLTSQPNASGYTGSGVVGSYLTLDGGRTGFGSTNPPVSPAVEVNNANLSDLLPLFVWMRFRGLIGNYPCYEFVAPGNSGQVGGQVGYQAGTVTVGGGLWTFNLVEPVYSGGVTTLTATGETVDVKDANNILSASTVGDYTTLAPSSQVNPVTGNNISTFAQIPASGSGSNFSILSTSDSNPIPVSSGAQMSGSCSVIQFDLNSGFKLVQVGGSGSTTWEVRMVQATATVNVQYTGVVTAATQTWYGTKNVLGDIVTENIQVQTQTSVSPNASGFVGLYANDIFGGADVSIYGMMLPAIGFPPYIAGGPSITMAGGLAADNPDFGGAFNEFWPVISFCTFSDTAASSITAQADIFLDYLSPYGTTFAPQWCVDVDVPYANQGLLGSTGSFVATDPTNPGSGVLVLVNGGIIYNLGNPGTLAPGANANGIIANLRNSQSLNSV